MAVPWTQEELARQLERRARSSVTRQMVSRWELGLRPSLFYQRHLAELFGRSREELGFFDTVATAAEKANLPPLLDLPAAGPADQDYVEAIRSTVQQLVALDNRLGGDELAPLAVRHLRAVQRRINAGEYGPGLRRELHAAAAELAELAAWLLHEADQQEAAQRMNHEALFLARLAGDRSIELLILNNVSFIENFQGRPGAALSVTSAVLEGGLTSRLESMFRMQCARALAQLGQRSAALRTLEQARAQFQDGVTNQDPAWAWWMDERQITAHAGRCHSELGDRSKGVTLLLRAGEMCLPHWHEARFFLAATTLQVLVEAGDWSKAERAIETALPYVGEVGSGRAVRLLRGATTRIAASDAGSTLQQAGQHLDEVLTAAGYRAQRE
jgi:transcriptional regulator with XRE-family HTH domain